VNWLLRTAACGILILWASGCGTTQKHLGREQLLLSDAVDRSIDRVDLSTLSGRRVYLDSQYISSVKGVGFVNANYIISALRQKLITSECLIQSGREDADYIIEARVGALGTDNMTVTYGLPASNGLSQAATLVSGIPAVPAIPEISIAKRNATLSTSKVVLFAYHRETGTPVWQSGSAVARSDAKDSWFFGAGPFQRGTIYDGVQFAGGQIRLPWTEKKSKKSDALTMAESHAFVDPAQIELQIAAEEEADEHDSDIVPASHSQVHED